jgi:serine/threonine-protein kinase
MAVITQLNFHMSSQPDWRLHTKIQAVLAGWAIASFLFHVLLRSGFRPDRVRVLWSSADIVCMTIVIKLLETIEPGPAAGQMVVRVETTLLVGFPLLIAASGLWWRVHLVWITTVLAMAAFCGLYVDAAIRPGDGPITWSPSPDLIHPNIFLAGLILTGYVVVRQVKRILALGRYYEHRTDV